MKHAAIAVSLISLVLSACGVDGEPLRPTRETAQPSFSVSGKVTTGISKTW